jgi:hypothetical protein
MTVYILWQKQTNVSKEEEVAEKDLDFGKLVGSSISSTRAGGLSNLPN